MPFNYTTPVTETIRATEEKEVKAIEITNLFIRLRKKRIDATYIKGYDDGAGGVSWSADEESISYRDDAEFGLTEYTDFVTRNMSTYTDVKTGMYNEVAALLGLTGTIS